MMGQGETHNDLQEADVDSSVLSANDGSLADLTLVIATGKLREAHARVTLTETDWYPSNRKFAVSSLWLRLRSRYNVAGHF